MPFEINRSINLRKYFFSLLLSFVFSWLFMQPAFAATLSCNSCTTCTSQIAAATSGDTVELTADLTGGTESTCITFDHKDGVILDCQNQIITGPYWDGIPPYFFGIKLLSADNNTIRNCTVQNFYEAINIEGSSSNLIDDVTAAHSFQNGILLDRYSNNNTISNSTAEANGNRGFYIYYNCNNNTIMNSDSANNTIGVNVEYSSGNILDNLTIDDNVYGVGMAYCENNILKNSRINDNSDAGIAIAPADHNSTYARYNTIYNNYFKNTTNVTINDATDSQPNYFNTTLNCSSGQNIISGACIGGNFWTTPTNNGFSDTCTDANSNGVCDLAYTFSAINIDNYPLASALSGDLIAPASPAGLSVM